ncbi:MAG: hypothetical protein K6E29_06610, partial [Cyanobacteria bacterium RUI128]|nr:hypothetical protein [Cyanobacteria bacterium RUI128]
MRINNIQSNSRNEVIVVSRKVNGANPSFQSQKTKPAAVLTKTIFDRLEVDMSTKVGFNGEKSYGLAPLDFKDGLGTAFRKMGINWDTHIDPSNPRRSYM